MACVTCRSWAVGEALGAARRRCWCCCHLTGPLPRPEHTSRVAKQPGQSSLAPPVAVHPWVLRGGRGSRRWAAATGRAKRLPSNAGHGRMLYITQSHGEHQNSCLPAAQLVSSIKRG